MNKQTEHTNKDEKLNKTMSHAFVTIPLGIVLIIIALAFIYTFITNML